MVNKSIPVRVALRCRPLVEKEKVEGCCECLEFVDGEPQVTIGQQKTFTYDYVYNTNSTQAEVYAAVKPLIKGIFKGYNATVLAYGQTGSGKTFTMGGGSYDTDDGIIPRVIADIYKGIIDHPDDSFEIRVSYLEIYKEELIDLLVDPAKREKDAVAIREDIQGGIKLVGLQEESVSDGCAMLDCLERGSHGRTTGATAMNARSSRSHAIFTIHINKTSKSDAHDSFKVKFHLVDLAGSERAKKTQAQGDRFREGVNINMGLLALGNVISALGDENAKNLHIPYRNSKLTRILQDSLGGNSHTVMIACVSPADSNMDETLTTLRYSDRARQIKNKPVVNRDPHAAEICKLKAVIQQLQSQLVGSDGSTRSTETCPTDTNNTKLIEELNSLKEYAKKLEEDSQKMTNNLQVSLEQNTKLCEKLILVEMERDNIKEKLNLLKEQAKLSESVLNNTDDLKNNSQAQEQIKLMHSIQETITELEADGTEAMKSILKEQVASFSSGSPQNSDSDTLENCEETNESEPGKQEGDQRAKKYLIKQSRLAKELEDLNHMLEQKQELAMQMNNNDQTIHSIKQEYEQTTKVLEKEVEQLHKEKDELLHQLNVKKDSNTKKLSEQRRQRLKECEQKISTLNRKISEQNKMLKMKESTDKQLQRLNTEIKSMKVQRVKLMKTMKEDAEAFRKWKMQKDKELIQLKAKDLKRQAEMTKLERKHEQTRAVLKRKADEAVAVNKRLKDALLRQKAAAADRMKKQDRHELNVKDRIQKWLKNELDVLVSVQEAKTHLQSLIEDRKTLAKQLSACNKRYEINDDSQDEDVSELKKEIKIIEAEIELRNAQISDIQQKLVDADQEEKNKQRWNNIHTMGDAKCALRSILDMAVHAKVEASSTRADKLKVQLAEEKEKAYKTIEQSKKKLKALQQEKEKENMNLKKEYESKILYLLNELKHVPTSEVSNSAESQRMAERMKFQQKEIERLTESYDHLMDQASEVQALKRELTVAKYKSRNVSLMPDISAPLESSPFIGSVIKKKRTVISKVFDDDQNASDYSDLSEESDNNEDLNDPDWQAGFTPGVPYQVKKRNREGLVSKLFESGLDSTGSDSDSGNVKTPTVSGSFVPDTPMDSCQCRGTCATSRCRCVKSKHGCSKGCSCLTSKCKNREADSRNMAQTETRGTSNDHPIKMETKSGLSNDNSLGATLNTTYEVSQADTTFLVGDSGCSENSSKTSSQNVTQSTLSTSLKRTSCNLDDDGHENMYKQKRKRQKSLFPNPDESEKTRAKNSKRSLKKNRKYFSEINA